MKAGSQHVMEKIATFIVDKRNLFFLLYLFAIIFSIYAMGWAKVENDITAYLSEDTETRQGVEIMEREFTTFGSAKVMLANISYDHAKEIASEIEMIEGVSGVTLEQEDKYYQNASALIEVSFKGTDKDEISLVAMEKIREVIAPYDSYVSTTIGVDTAKQLADEMQVIVVIAAVIIVLVLFFTSKSYGEIPVLILTFGVAALLNMGTNFLLGKISFISNSVAVVLQLALAIDYAIILCHRFTEEHETLPVREACIAALAKAIPEIASSSLTTMSGLFALVFMHFGIGGDLAVVLIKAIILSLLSVFTLMPGLLIVFSKLIDKTQHRNFIPSIRGLGKFAVKTRYVIPPVFVILVLASFVFFNRCPFSFGVADLRAPRRNAVQMAEDKVNDTFGKSNMLALVVPSGDYISEGKLLRELERYDEVDSTLGLATTEAMDDYVLTDGLTPRAFSELIDLDYEVAQLLYAAYAVNDEDYGKIVSDIGEYSVPLIDMFMFLYDQVDKGYVTLEDELQEDLEDLHSQLTDAKKQLMSEDYSRMLIYLNLPEESEETFAFLNTIHEVAAKYYDEDVYIVGNSTSNYDLSSTFATDNLVISILSALFVILILMFTFKSAGLPVLLIIVIQASIWMNFSFPYLQNKPLFFLGYLVVSSIQMGANIDYAIVITSRYMALKKTLPIKEAIVEALNQSFPTILTSGVILASAGIVISQLSTDGTIAALGLCIGRGTIISMILVIFVLPQILLLGDSIIERTTFAQKKSALVQERTGKLLVNGRVKGYVSGVVDMEMKGVLEGDLKAMVSTGIVEEVEEETAHVSKQL